MGVLDLLPRLPGGKRYHHSFYGLKWSGRAVPIDAASALFQFAAYNAANFLRGNHKPALIQWAKFLVYLRSMCGWNMIIYMDGMENVDKEPEIQRRRDAVEAAIGRNDLRGQIKNNPEYIAKAIEVCNFLSIEVHVSPYEADPQVSYVSLKRNLIPVTGDSDLLAYGVPSLIIVKGFNHEYYRTIDLTVEVNEGEYPLFDLYKKHGPIVFQLYAACRGCDFTAAHSGVPGIGYAHFISSASKVEEPMNSTTLSKVLWSEKKDVIEKAGFKSVDELEVHLQHVVDVYSLGNIYDNSSSIRKMNGQIVEQATELSKQHMAGKVNSRTCQEHPTDLRGELNDLAKNCNQLILQTAADASTILGVRLPENRDKREDCTVKELRNYIAARGGKISGKREQLLTAAKAHQFLEGQVAKRYVDRNPNPNGSLYLSVNTSGTRSVSEILNELYQNKDKFDAETCGLISETYTHFSNGLFDDSYDNISRTAPELKPEFVYKHFGHIIMSKEEKNIGDALRRCIYATKITYHALASVPESNTVFILSKCQASMTSDDKTKDKTDNNLPKKKEYLVIMELVYKPTCQMTDCHNLGIFVSFKRSYCTACVAGAALCRHRPERLWYQYHHWTDQRLGIDRPSTLDVCSWSAGRKALCCDVEKKLSDQQTVKHESTLEDQTAKNQRGVERNCTEGNSCDYQVHLSSQK